jgi:hypothetical protein
MPSYEIPASHLNTTDAGSADGYLTVADNSTIFPNAIVNLIKADASDGGEYQVVDLVSTTKIGLRKTGKVADYGRSNLTAFLTGSKIFQEAQLVKFNALPPKYSNA